MLSICDVGQENENKPFSAGGVRHFDLSAPEAREVCALPTDGTPLLVWAHDLLLKSSSAARMIKEAENQGWFCELATLEGQDFHLDVATKRIVLDNEGIAPCALARSAYFRARLLISLIRALRDVWQEERSGAFNGPYSVPDILTFERVRTSDLDVLVIKTAWELRLAGQSDLWRHILGSERSDMATAFLESLKRDTSSMQDGRALFAAFSQWFCDEERVNACDHETLCALDDSMKELQAQYAYGVQKFTPIEIERLSCLPNKTAYLRGLGDEILHAPLYAGMNDMINQSHLMQILEDIKITWVQHVPFRSAALAEKIFPNGLFTIED